MAGVVRNDFTATAILSWVAGYVDTAGFLKLNHLFTAHVTGNLVVAGAELAGVGEDAVWVRLAVIPVFMAAVVMTSVIARTRSASLSTLMWFEAITLLIFMGIGLVVVPGVNPTVNPSAMFTAGAAGVFAMGVRNALMRESLGTFAQTTVMTGNFTQVIIDLTRLTLIHDYDHRSYSTIQEQEIRQRVRKFSSAVIGFVIGAVVGAFLMKIIGFWSILFPAIAIAVLAFDTQQHERLSTHP